MEKRLLSVEEAAQYTGLGKTKFREWAIEIGAKVKIGGRALYDIEIINKALEEIREGAKG